MGLKGSGKTKQLLDAIQEALEKAHGDIVCIEYGKKLTYDVNYRVRLVDSKEYCVNNLDMLMPATSILPMCLSTTCIRPSVLTGLWVRSL